MIRNDCMKFCHLRSFKIIQDTFGFTDISEELKSVRYSKRGGSSGNERRHKDAVLIVVKGRKREAKGEARKKEQMKRQMRTHWGHSTR